jgi:hypothetical protein
MVTKIDPGQLYIITELDAATNTSTGYYKIGIVRNERETADRIKKFQTGNPNRVVPYKVFETEAPMFIENTLHAEFAAHQVGVEWFKFDSSTLKKVVDRAAALKKEYDPKFKTLHQKYWLTPSNGTLVLSGSDLAKAENIRDDAYQLCLAKEKADYLRKTAEHQLKSISADHEFGIVGVTDVKITPAKNEFNFSKWKKAATPAQLKKCEKSKKVADDFTLLFTQTGGNHATAGHWKGIFTKEATDEETAKAGIPKLTAGSLKATSLSRTPTIEAFHEEYCKRDAEVSLLKKKIQAKEILLMLMCVDHDGIQGICSWNRSPQDPEINESLMKKHFHADLVNPKFFKSTKASVAVSVHKFRPYL